MSDERTTEEFKARLASQEDTLRHVEEVRKLIGYIVAELKERGREHDMSKLAEPELPIFAEYGPKLAGMTYGSQEYKDALCARIEAIVNGAALINQWHPHNSLFTTHAYYLFICSEEVINIIILFTIYIV